MPSFADSAVIFILALMLFGPKKLPQLARQLGKLMAEFRRASNEFRMQMEDELRIEEQKEHQKKVDAIAGPPSDLPDPPHPHRPAATAETTTSFEATEQNPASTQDEAAPASPVAEATPIAESGSLRMMPPSTGLPVERGSSARDNGFTSHESPQPGSNGNHAHGDSNDFAAIPEHSIMPPPIGMSSEEPAAETRTEEQTHA